MPNHPIFAPVFHGDVTSVKKILDADNSLISIRDAKQLTPLHVAASRGQNDVIELLLDYGADVHGPTEDGGWTPVVFAAYRGHFEAVKLLVKHHAGITEAAGNPIHYAGQRKHKEICRFLANNGAIDDLLPEGDATLLDLFRAAYSYDPEAVEQMLSNRPELVHGRDKNGRTPLHAACAHGDIKTVKVLLRFGADTTVRDSNGQTPADRAEAHRHRNVNRLLMRQKR